MTKLYENILFFMVCIGALLPIACANDEGVACDDPGSAMSITLNVDRITAESATRAEITPVEGETKVNSLYLFFFDVSGDQSGVLNACIPMSDGTLNMNMTYVLPVAGTPLTSAAAYHIIGVANIENYVADADEWISQWDGVTEAHFRDNAMVRLSGVDDELDYTTRSIKPAALLMSGSVTKTANEKNIQMMLTRNVSRFEVKNATSTHHLKRISIWNAYTMSSVTGDMILNFSAESKRHTPRFYGLECNNVASQVGGLYAFENFVETPTDEDKQTTCLIIGLEPVNGGGIRYYRANVNSGKGSQRLKRNFAYNVTIVTVTGKGYATENEAWKSATNQLGYIVNNWDMDDNGLIVSDEHSILAVPVKTVRIGASGGESSYTITTFSTLENPASLRVKSTIFDPADDNITATIKDGALVIAATPMRIGEELRTGVITVTYAGLEATVNVIQAPSVDVYLEVTLEDGWKETLPPIANAMSEYVYVNASGLWTAKLYGSKNFALINSMGDYVTQLSSAELTNNRFRICTSAPNASKTIAEKGFALITLDSDPEKYVAVVTICQSSCGGIDTDPVGLDDSGLVFFGGGSLETTTGNLVQDSKVFTFDVFSQETINVNSVKLTGMNYDKFVYTYTPTSASTGRVTVRTKGFNISTANYVATLAVTDNKNGTVFVSLTQKPLVLTLEISDPQAAPVTGGTTGVVSVFIDDPREEWTAEVTLNSENVVNHVPSIVDVNGTKIVSGVYTNKSLQVEFPKVYYPNREKEIAATLKVTTRAGFTATIVVYQETLVSKGVTIWDVRSGQSGSLNHNLFKGYIEYIGSFSTSYNEGVTTYVHVGTGSMALTYDWSSVETFRSEKDGITMIVADELGGINNSTSPLNKCGYTVVNNPDAFYISSNNKAKLASNIESTRIGKILTIQGKNYIQRSSIPGFYRTTSTTELSVYPSSATVVMTADGRNNPVMLIDPLNGLVFLGASQTFDNGGSAGVGGTSTDAQARLKFMKNYIEYVHNAARYGSHFTDMLIEGSIVPEPWNAVWGIYAWPN